MSENQSPEPQCCAACGVAANTRCSRCLKVYYCSGQCQRSQWKQHKSVCAPTGSSRPAVGTAAKQAEMSPGSASVELGAVAPKSRREPQVLNTPELTDLEIAALRSQSTGVRAALTKQPTPNLLILSLQAGGPHAPEKTARRRRRGAAFATTRMVTKRQRRTMRDPRRNSNHRREMRDAMRPI